VQVVRILGVHDELGVHRAQRLVQLVAVQRGELGHAGVGQEGLEAVHPGGVQGGQGAGVARDGAAPESDVHVELTAGGVLLDRERVHVDGRRQAVQWHVHDGGDPTGRRGPGGGGEALPLGAAGLVDVHVGVDQAGQQRHVAQVDLLGGGRGGGVVLDGDDPARGDGDRGGALTLGEHGTPGAHHQIHHALSLTVRRRRTAPSREAGVRFPTGAGTGTDLRL
jgi:hypothetical protein